MNINRPTDRDESCRQSDALAARPGSSTGRVDRRSWLRFVSGCLASAMASRQTVADDDVSSLYVDDEIDEAIGRAIDFLISRQQSNGAISDGQYPLAMSSLAVMAMAAVGQVPGDSGAEGKAIEQAIDFVLMDEHRDPHGYFGNSDGSRMYGHGITTLMLTEMLGMGATVQQNQRIHDTLVEALAIILAAQAVPKPEMFVGGWRYTPDSRDSDLSVTVWQLMALRSAKNDGLDVPGEAIEDALGYLRNSYTSPLDDDGVPRLKVAGFSYTPGTRRATFAMTAAGLLAIQVCGRYDSPLVRGASAWLLEHPPAFEERFFFYGIYYYAQGMHQVGGKHAEAAAQRVPALLLDRQRSDGAWQGRSGDEQKYGEVYATALAVLSLSVRYHYLPIYQR